MSDFDPVEQAQLAVEVWRRLPGVRDNRANADIAVVIDYIDALVEKLDYACNWIEGDVSLTPNIERWLHDARHLLP